MKLFKNLNEVMSIGQLPPNSIVNGDCLEVMNYIPDKSIDLIFSDLPFGTTNCKWDIPIPLNDYIEDIKRKKIIFLNKEQFYLNCFMTGISLNEANIIWNTTHKKGLWSHYERIIKDNGAILLFAQTPFDKVLGVSNLNLL